jgi:uncharacterized membrane protein YgcG
MKFLLAPLVLLALTLGFATPSFAAQTWRPQFNAGHHVYLDPALQGGNNPVNLDGLEAQLQAQGAKDGVEYFFVMTLKGDETTPMNVFAQTREREVMGNWLGQSGFPTDRAVFIYVVRLNTDWTKSAVAQNVAPELAKRGIDPTNVKAIDDQFSHHPSDGSVNPDALLPQNPKKFALTVVQTIGQTMDNHAAQVIADQKAAAAQAVENARQAEADRVAAIAHAKTMHTVGVVVEIGGPILLLLIVFFVLYTRKRKSFGLSAAEIAKWDGLFQTANSNYIELERHYLDFLKRQGANWKDKFKGLTLAKYTEAITDYAILSARIQTAQALIESAKKANDSGNIFSLAGNEHALALLTTSDVTIDSKSLSFEQQGLFGALLDGKSNTKKPNELLEDMDNLFRVTNSTMAAIMEAFEGSDKNKKEIDGLFAEVEALKGNLTEASLSFAAYQPSYDALVKAKDAFLAIVDSDPLEAYEESKAVETDCEALKVTIGHAIDLRKSLSTTDEAIKAAAARITEVRGQAADYNYPDGGTPASGAAVNYLLNEVGNNPDESLTAAKDSLASAITLVVAGKLDASKTAKGEAEAHAAEAVAVVAKILAAKELVQKQVPVVHSALDKLTTEIPGGDEALASLNASFLPKNFSNAPGQLTHAKAVHDSTTSQLAAVKQAFLEQRFVAAGTLVTTVTGDIQGSRDGILAIHTRLGELTDLRQHAKTQTASNAQTTSGLTSKIAASAFTTSAQTDGQFHALLPVLANHETDVAKAVTDWPTAAQSADQLKSDLATIDGAIDSEKHAYDHAVSTLAELRQAVAGAVAEGNSNIVRSQATSLIGQVQQILGQDEAAITVPKSDWNSLSQRFETNIQTATSAHNAATADKNAYNDAVTAINNAQSYINGVEGASYSSYSGIGGRYSGTYGQNVTANCSTAQSELNSASQLLSAQRYEDAERQAQEARNAADRAKEQAEAETQQLIMAAAALWQIEENARIEREAEERREQERRDEERRAEERREEESRSSSSGGSFGGGGNDSGGGFSGGGNDSGGGFS